MIDMTEVLLEAAKHRRTRKSEDTRNLIDGLVRATNGVLKWDIDSGEDWARIVRGGSDHTLLVYARAPLVIAAHDTENLNRLSSILGLIEVPDTNSRILRADPEALTGLFGNEFDFDAFDSNCFSARDLFVTTV